MLRSDHHDAGQSASYWWTAGREHDWRVAIVTLAVLAPSPAFAHGGELIGLGLVQAVVVGFCLALLRALPKAPGRNKAAVLGLLVGAGAYWLLLPMLFVVDDSMGSELLLAGLLLLPALLPIIGYAIGVWRSLRADRGRHA